MGDALQKNHYYTLEEYEAIVLNSTKGERYEYVDGQIIPFTDEYTTNAHNQVVQNAADLLKAHFYPKCCRVYTENVRLQIKDKKEYRLPDVMATCSERDKTARDGVSDPIILVEVLSPATAMEDLASKADVYRTIPSLQAYVIVNPEQIWVRVYEKNSHGKWLPDVAYTALSSSFTIGSLDLSFHLSALYRFVV